jgi:hypothetical protein
MFFYKKSIVQKNYNGYLEGCFYARWEDAVFLYKRNNDLPHMSREGFWLYSGQPF